MTLRSSDAMKLSTAMVVGGVLFAASSSHAGHPLYSLVPATPVALHRDSVATATIIYTGTNPTRLAQTIELLPMHGVTQDVMGPGAGAQPFVLQGKSSCTSTITGAASGVSAHGIHGGLVVCRRNTHTTRATAQRGAPAVRRSEPAGGSPRSLQ